MEEEVSWKPPWDCVENEDDQINLSSPFRNPDPHAFRFVPINGHPDFTTAKKQLHFNDCLLYTSPSPRDRTRSRMPSSA